MLNFDLYFGASKGKVLCSKFCLEGDEKNESWEGGKGLEEELYVEIIFSQCEAWAGGG